jgi:hypothetical protein
VEDTNGVLGTASCSLAYKTTYLRSMMHDKINMLSYPTTAQPLCSASDLCRCWPSLSSSSREMLSVE